MSDTITKTQLKSFIKVDSESHFPIQNLPYGVFLHPEEKIPHIATAIGDYVLSLRTLEKEGLFENTSFNQDKVLSENTLNRFMSLSKSQWKEARSIISHLLREDIPTLRDNQSLRSSALIPMQKVTMLMPVNIGDYTDFYASREHATNVGTMFRGPENALQPNWLHLPVGYHGRASSIVLSGTNFPRPRGQVKKGDNPLPEFGPSLAMDYELEMGFFVGPGNELGHPISIENVSEHIFGMVLLNDWSARDIQRWEYVPLGPFNGKNFFTTISPWIVTMEALEPFRIAGPTQNNPKPLLYLQTTTNWAFDILLEVYLKSKNMKEPDLISTSNLKYLYWSIAQQLVHHSITGCNMRTGDLLGTGTISGPKSGNRGCLLELTWGGKDSITLSNGETRSYLNDGDEVILTGYCEQKGIKIGFGEARGMMLSAL